MAERRRLAEGIPNGPQLVADIEALEASGDVINALDAEIRLIAAGSACIAKEVSEETNTVPRPESSFSTNRLNEPDTIPPLTQLRGGQCVDQQRLYRAFAVFMGLMHEVTDDPFRQAKPSCVASAAEEFIALMEKFRGDRVKASSWVKGQQMLEPFVQFYRGIRANWVEKPSQLIGNQRIPSKPTAEEAEKLEDQRKTLSNLASRFSYDCSSSKVKAVIERCLAAPSYITAASGPKQVAYDAVTAFLSLDGETLSGSTIEHSFSDRTHIEKSAHADRSSFFVPDSVHCVSASDVLQGLTIARLARAYYLRYLIDENIKRLPAQQLRDPRLPDEDLDQQPLREKSAQWLGLCASSYEPQTISMGATTELASWDTRTMGTALPSELVFQTSPFRFSPSRFDSGASGQDGNLCSGADNACTGGPSAIFAGSRCAGLQRPRDRERDARV